MNEMDLLQRMRADVPLPSETELDAAETRFVTAMRARTVVRRHRFPIRTAVLTGAVAAAVLVAGLMMPRAAPPARPAAVLQLLDKAALAAERTPELRPRPDQFILYQSRTMYESGEAGGGGSHYLYRSDRKVWASVDGKRDGVIWRKFLPPRPFPGATLPAGALKEVGQEKLFPAPACDHAGTPEELRSDYEHLRTLPTDAAGMLAVLKQRAGGAIPEDPDIQVWRAVGDLLTESYLPPAQRAAVFRAAELIGGVTVVQGARDGADRAGVAVARYSPYTGIRSEIIFNPETYLYQGEREYVVDAAKAGAPAGSETSATAELSVTVVDAPPKLPPADPDPKLRPACK